VNREVGVSLGGVTLAAVAAAALPFIGNDYFVGIGFTLLTWIALTEAWMLISGMAGYVSLGHVAFVGIGGQVAALSWQLLPVWGILPTAGIAAGTLALLVGYPCLRVRGPYFVILTFGLSELLKFVVVNIESALVVSGRVLFGTPDLQNLFYMMLGLAWVSLSVALIVRRSRFGAGLRAIRENEEAAETIGIAASSFKLAAFALSAVVPGIVGALIAMRISYFEPLDFFSPRTSLLIVTMAVVGGSDKPLGPLLGVVFLVLLQELLWANLPQLYMIMVGVLLIGVVVWIPEGILGGLQRLTARGTR
jgi:branched-chain amino acid transport system permease protein